MVAQTFIGHKKLLLADMESTIIKQECLDELAFMAGLKDEVADITKRAMNGTIDFEVAIEERLALLEGLPMMMLDKLLGELSFMEGAFVLVSTMRAKGAKAVLVSGGFTYFADYVAKRLGFDAYHANQLEVKNGCLTGKILGDFLSPSKKADILCHYQRQYQLKGQDILAVGDGANDLEMLQLANDMGGAGIAFCGKPILRENIPLYRQLNHPDLTELLHRQGIPPEEFTT